MNFGQGNKNVKQKINKNKKTVSSILNTYVYAAIRVTRKVW